MTHTHTQRERERESRNSIIYALAVEPFRPVVTESVFSFAMSFEEESITSTPPDVSKTVVEEVMSDLLPKKSRQDCDQIYAYYVEWRKKKNVSLDYHSENILLAYMSELSQKYVPSTFWKVFSRAEEDLADQRACRYWEKHLWSRTF